MLVPVFCLPPRVVCLDHNDGLHGEFHDLPSLWVGRPLGDHLTGVDTSVAAPWQEAAPPSAKQTICVSPSVDCLKPNNSRVISIKIRGDTFVQRPNSILATSQLFPLKNHFPFLRPISTKQQKLLKITTIMSKAS